jgi:hypothetical protein
MIHRIERRLSAIGRNGRDLDVEHVADEGLRRKTICPARLPAGRD